MEVTNYSFILTLSNQPYKKNNGKMVVASRAPPGASRAPVRPLLPRMSPSLVPRRRIARSTLTIAGTARPRSAGEASTTTPSPPSIAASGEMNKVTDAAATAAAAAPAAPLPPAPVRNNSSSVSDRIVVRPQRPGSAPPAPTLERAPRADVAAGIGRRHWTTTTAAANAHQQQQQHRPVDRVLAASAPAEEAGSPLWAAPELERVVGQQDFFPEGWVGRAAGGLPPAPVRSSSSSPASTSSSSSSYHHHRQRSRPIFPELHGSHLIVIDRHPFAGDAPLLIPLTRGTTAAAAVLGILSLAAAAAAAAVARRVRGGGKRRQQQRRQPASPLSPWPSSTEDDANSADALLKRRREAAAARLRSRFAGALDGGNQSGGGSLGRDDDDEDGDESDEGKRRRNREAERSLRSFFSKSKMHLVDEDAWSKEKKN